MGTTASGSCLASTNEVSGRERETQQLLVSPPSHSDRAAYHAHFMRPEIERWLRPSPLPPFNVNLIDGLLLGDCEHWKDHGFGPWVLREKAGGEFAGRGGLAWTSVEGVAEVELPWSVEPELQGRGLATEAACAAVEWAAELGFEEAIALTLPDNLASQRVAEKAGFRLDGACQHAGLPHYLYRRRLAPGYTATQ